MMATGGGTSGPTDIGRCDIDVRSLNLSAAEFEERYVLQGRPVLLPLDAVVTRQVKPPQEYAARESIASDVAGPPLS